jgi:hypothetical protein
VMGYEHQARNYVAVAGGSFTAAAMYSFALSGQFRSRNNDK